ncbi:MAG TPA: hypothetical protein VHT96_15705 [Clostridia bacterium]|nr:hypothetical protein [Clostridia bacterium]
MYNKLSIPEQQKKLRQLSDSLDEITGLYCNKEYSKKNDDTYYLDQIDMIRLELLRLKNKS